MEKGASKSASKRATKEATHTRHARKRALGHSVHAHTQEEALARGQECPQHALIRQLGRELELNVDTCISVDASAHSPLVAQSQG